MCQTYICNSNFVDITDIFQVSGQVFYPYTVVDHEPDWVRPLTTWIAFWQSFLSTSFCLVFLPDF